MEAQVVGRLFDFGLLGIAVVVIVYIARYFFQQYEKRLIEAELDCRAESKRLDEKLDTLKTKFDDYHENDRKRLIDTIEKSNEIHVETNKHLEKSNDLHKQIITFIKKSMQHDN